MSKGAFLAELELLPRNGRIRRAMDEGRRAAAGDVALLEELGRSSEAYERLLALAGVHGSKDGARVLEALADPSRSVRRSACTLVALYCDDFQAQTALDRIVEKRALRGAVTHLVRRRRSPVVDAFLAARMARGRDPVIIDMLPLGSQALVERFFADIEQGGGDACWERLVARHPALVARRFREDVRRSPSLDPRLRHRLVPRLAELAERAPDETFEIVAALLDGGEDPSVLAAALAMLARARPRETFDLVRARHESGRPARPPGAFGALSFDRIAHRLGAERLDYLIRHAWGALGDGRRGIAWFLRLSTDDREAVVTAFLEGGRSGWGAFLFRRLDADGGDPRARSLREQAFERWSSAAQAADGTISPEVLAFLPRDLREREAHRHLNGCPALVSKPERRMGYARLLPFAEARQVLAPFLGHPEGEERARAQRTLIAAVELDRGAAAEALAGVKARRFEQDPVRMAMIQALANLPVTRFRAEHLEAVGGILQDALDAADLSPATASAAERWVARLFRVDGAWGARWLVKLLAARGSVSTPWTLGAGLTRAEAERLAPALAELTLAWSTRERAGALIALGHSLGIRLPVVTPVLDALERLARELPFVGVAAAALDLLHQHDRARFARLVPELLGADRSFVLLPIIARHVSLSRQDLLADLVWGVSMTGRFATGRTHWVVDFGVGFERWTANQQREYADGLVALLDDPARDVPTLRFAITTLARLAFADAAPLLRFASDPRPPLREMAIRALPWLDARQGVPVLIEALGDDRARWAIYALRKVFSELAREDALAELRAVPTTKVTVAKEVVRLLGALGGDEAYEELMKLDRPTTHRDVRIALLRALWDHLDEPRTWELFARAALDPDWIVASKLADVPLGRLSDEAEARVAALLSTILGRAEPEARLSLLARAAFLPLRDQGRALFQRLLGHLDADVTEEAAAALSAVLYRMLSSEADVVGASLRTLVPRRRHLVALLPGVISRLGPYAQPWHVKVAGDLLSALRADEAATPCYLSLGARLWGWKDLIAALVELSQRELLHHDAMEAALEAVRSCVHPSLLDETLQKQADPRLRRLGLAALVSSAGPKDGWTKERRARLDLYRQDPAPSVAGPASFVFPAEVGTGEPRPLAHGDRR